MNTSRSPGFALISTLAVLVVVSILVVAYTSTVRTERAASVNFSERERADAIGQAMVSRILSDHASPLVRLPKGEQRLKPFEVDRGTAPQFAGSYLPTPDTQATYFADPPLEKIFRMNPQTNLSTDNSLVRISQPTDGTAEERPAFNPYEWAYSRIKVTPESDDETKKAFLPHDSTGKPITPQWVDFYASDAAEEAEPIAVGEVAFAIWDESGKIDINMAGEDISLNGMAPHHLGWESLTSPDQAKALLAHLDGEQGRQRSNFSLRSIDPKAAKGGGIGDDRWLFSMDELVTRNFFPPSAYKHLTTYSRDFDVRPEWDGNRAANESKKFLRSYINNPELFRTFTYRAARPDLVENTFDERRLKATLQTPVEGDTMPVNEDSMQVMRLMSALRQMLPAPTVAMGPTDWLRQNEWTKEDIYAIALNIAQATAPPLDQNLFAHNRAKYKGELYRDETVRLGVRISPYISEVAVRVKRKSADEIEVTEFFEIWNPYPTDFSGITFRAGSWTGGGGRPSQSTMWRYESFTFPGPKPYSFKVVQNTADRTPKLVKTYKGDQMGRGEIPFSMKCRPYIYPTSYWAYQGTYTQEPGVKQGPGGKESIEGAVSNGCFWEGIGLDEKAALVYCIDAARYKKIGDEAWASFQIDDPRMGPFTRVTAYPKPLPGSAVGEENVTPMWYSWQYYKDTHSLPKGDPYHIANKLGGSGVPDPVGTVTTGNPRRLHPLYGEKTNMGYNQNFGSGWRGAGDFTLEKAMDTFALPGRPFLNVGELGSVFIFRPWRTLTFAGTSAPQDTTMTYSKTKTPLLPTALLDYYTTIGTVTADTNIPFQRPADIPPDAGVPLSGPRVAERKQSQVWLFERVATQGDQGKPPVPIGQPLPDTNLRPIRGRINLNSASKETLKTLLKAPYRLPRSKGLMMRKEKEVPSNLEIEFIPNTLDLKVTVPPEMAELIAVGIVGDPDKNTVGIRPLRSMADLGRLDTWPVNKPANLLTNMHRAGTLPDPVIDAMIGRLAQFGTVRQQIFRMDVVARSLNRNVEKQRLKNPSIKRVVTAEVRFQTRLYFDTFSRKAFVESLEYR